MESSINGIAIMDLNGSGKSTLAHALAKVIGYYEIDVEDLEHALLKVVTCIINKLIFET